jgi:hypothetical protein
LEAITIPVEFEVAVHVGTDAVAVVGPAVLAPQTRLAHSNGNRLENNKICAHLFVRQKNEQIGQLSSGQCPSQAYNTKQN